MRHGAADDGVTDAAAAAATDRPAGGGLCSVLGLPWPEMTELIDAAAARGWTVAAAESLTGGLFTAALTEVPGSSRVVRGSVVCYATDLKASLVGVDAALLDRVGPVDREVARQLAYGARRRCGATIGVGLTGVAGPDPQHGHRPGTVRIAVVSEFDDDIRKLEPPPGDITRWSVRAWAVTRAVSMLRYAVLCATG